MEVILDEKFRRECLDSKISKNSVMLLTNIRAFQAASQMPRHAKASKFKRLVSQNKEPFWTENLFL